jgi:hypothetical protein
VTAARFAAALRPAVDRVYVTGRAAAGPRVRAVIAEFGVGPGFILSFYFGLLARPMPADGFAAATTYGGADMTEELADGVASVSPDGTWTLTPLGRSLGLALQRAIGDGAAERWSEQPIATMPGLAALPRLVDLLGRVLDAGAASGGPAFRAMAPVFEPDDATPAARVMSRLGALRHHRGDAHRAAWAAAGLTLDELRALPDDDPLRAAIEDDTNRRDAPTYATLSADERLELLATLAAVPG